MNIIGVYRDTETIPAEWPVDLQNIIKACWNVSVLIPSVVVFLFVCFLFWFFVWGFLHICIKIEQLVPQDRPTADELMRLPFLKSFRVRYCIHLFIDILFDEIF